MHHHHAHFHLFCCQNQYNNGSLLLIAKLKMKAIVSRLFTLDFNGKVTQLVGVKKRHAHFFMSPKIDARRVQ